MKESISFDKDLRKAIKKTIKPLAKSVKSTLGPSGTNVGTLSQIHLPVIVNDGVTVAKSFKPKDPLKKFVANIIKTVSQNTDNVAGDGTTTSITLTEAIVLEGIKNIEAGFSQIDVARGIKEATKIVLEKLDKKALTVKNNKNRLLQVATISANNDPELGKLISDAFTKVGVDGQIDVKDSTEGKTEIEILPGIKYYSGYESQMFTNTDTGEVVLDNCKILIYEGKMRSLDPIVWLLQEVRNANDSLLIIADDYDPICVDDLAANKIQGKLKICAVKSPGFGTSKQNSLEDIALVTNSTIVSKKSGLDLDSFNGTHIGTANTVKVNTESFTIIEDSVNKELIKKRISSLKKKSKTASSTDKEEILERIAKLSNGVAILHVSGDSPVEIAEKKYRIEDAINATRAAMEEGIVPGGGVALLKIKDSIRIPKLQNQSQEIGFNILLKALEAPIRTICNNSEASEDVVVNKVLNEAKFNYGYDARLKKYGDMIELGIIDPKKVTKTALSNASSVSQMMLTMNCAIYE